MSEYEYEEAGTYGKGVEMTTTCKETCGEGATASFILKKHYSSSASCNLSPIPRYDASPYQIPVCLLPKITSTGTQHTTVETADVRYICQPLKDLYVLLITNKTSNILLGIDTLHLFARVVSDLCRTAEEREILSKSFEILGAFDEVNKEAEAKEKLKRRAKQLEMQCREQHRSSGGGGNSYLGGGVSWYSAVPRFDTSDPLPTRITTSSPAPASSTRAPAFKGTGMTLGSKKAKQAELLDAMGGAALETTSVSLDISAPSTPSITASLAAAPASSERGSVPEIVAESVHIVIKEQLSLSLFRDGGVQSMKLEGDMNLITDADLAHIKIPRSLPCQLWKQCAV
ncbi:hypothetical protein BT96DRAFT_995876 [Gymnopus androsaceus JB14]|uniref:Coatomer subunit delta n=1 Tax=Gymnopus androsaceus JB14 TaxID=1447944 RepID=A0A6A4HJJ0_9AGAR|nr:hypothetical protein BT96DRAFT_995876 [Gymnopus androsaceus JB14]